MENQNNPINHKKQENRKQQENKEVYTRQEKSGQGEKANSPSVKKIVLIVVGCLSLGIGAVAAAIPLLPSFPFLLLAAICFAKGSERLNAWFKSTKLYKNNLESYVKGEGMTKAAKIRIMLMITIFFTFGFIMMKAVVVGRIVLVIVWLFHILYFVFKVKTKPVAN